MSDGAGADGTDGFARTLLVAGTASHVGKTTVVAGLCRALADAGVDVAPFKAQNMSNNAAVAVRPAAVREGDGQDRDGGADHDPDSERGGGTWGEIGVSQRVQAEAAGVAPTTDHNPVLLKPRGDGESQLVVDGVAVGHYAAGDYYDEHWALARGAAERAHRRLARDHEIVVAEGAGSIAEINLHDRDLANVETARFGGDAASEPAPVDVLLVGDIERGGVFASLVGTLELLPDDIRERIVGAVINKFRGDRSLLAPGVEAFEDRTGVPMLGVLRHEDPGLPAEDSLSLPARGERAVRGAADGVPEERAATVGVIRLPRVSNATDTAPLARTPGLRVAYRPPDASLADADAVVLPGSKNTVDDLLACREAGLGERLRAFEGPVIGLCGGYQLLGERLERVEVESTRRSGSVEGFGLLPVVTRFDDGKRVSRVEREFTPAGPLDGPGGTVTGYEIHAGATGALAPVDRPVGPESAAAGNAFGTYLHGLFDAGPAREALCRALLDEPPDGDGADSRDPLDAAAALVDGIDFDRVPALQGA